MHEVSPLVYSNRLQLLTAINSGFGGFGREICGHFGKVMKSSKAIYPFSNPVLFL